MSRRLTWSFVLGVALSLAALIASSDQDAIANLLRHDVGSLALKLALLIFVGGLVLVLFRERLSAALMALQRAISSTVRPHPRHCPERASSVQTLTQGLSIMGFRSLSISEGE